MKGRTTRIKQDLLKQDVEREIVAKQRPFLENRMTEIREFPIGQEVLREIIGVK